MVEVEGLWKSYGRMTALKGITFTARAGRVVGVLGENGSGKSTLFKILAGVTPASRGEARIQGRAIGIETRRDTAYLPEIDPFYGWMRIGEQLEFLAPFYPGWDMAKSRELLSFMGLTEDRKIGQLSHGQRARLKTVAAVSRPSHVVLMDEPLGGIDPPSRRRIISSLVSEFRVGEQTILISTHLVDEVEGIIDEVGCRRQGEGALEGNADELRSERGKSLSGLFEEVVE